MTQLSVNINKIATLRNARGTDQPNLVHVTDDLLSLGVRGITVHPRPDERHIKRQDVYEISQFINEYNKKNSSHIEFNIEGYPSEDFVNLVLEVRPDQCTLVPDPPDVLTSNAGWKLEENKELLNSVTEKFKTQNIRTSLFVDVFKINETEIKAIQSIGCERAELYTEAFAKSFNTDKQEQVLKQFISSANLLTKAGVELNAGHDLNQENLTTLVKAIPQLKEVSIGHALITEALYQGFKTTIQNYHRLLS